MPRAKAKSAPTPLAGQRLPNVEAPNQPYGAAADERAAQNVVPLRPPDASTPAAQAPPALSARTAPPGPAPGSLPFLEPTHRPNEPVTAGLPFGDGPGPEALTQGAVLPARPVTQAFDELSRSPNASSDLSTLAETARLLGL